MKNCLKLMILKIGKVEKKNEFLLLFLLAYLGIEADFA